MTTDQSRDEDGSSKSRGRSCLTVLALFLMYLLLSGILIILPMGFIGPVFFLGGLFLFGVIGLHYLLWGRALTRILQEQAEDASTDEIPRKD